jgi:hypothetical protein
MRKYSAQRATSPTPGNGPELPTLSLAGWKAKLMQGSPALGTSTGKAKVREAGQAVQS